MYCPNCGRKIDDPETTRFCPNCGKPTTSNASTKRGGLWMPRKVSPEEGKELMKKMVKVALITLAVMAVLCFIVTAVLSYLYRDVTMEDYITGDYELFGKKEEPKKETTQAPTTSKNKIDPDFYEEAFWIDDLQETCHTDVSNFIDEWKKKRICVSGYINHMDTLDTGICYIVLRPFDLETREFSYLFSITCYLEGDGGEIAQWIDINDFCLITGELDIVNSDTYGLTLRKCYI